MSSGGHRDFARENWKTKKCRSRKITNNLTSQPIFDHIPVIFTDKATVAHNLRVVAALLRAVGLSEMRKMALFH